MLVKKCVSLAVISATSLCLSACLDSGPPDGPPSMRYVENGGDDCNDLAEGYHGELWEGPGWCVTKAPSGYEWWSIWLEGDPGKPLIIGYCKEEEGEVAEYCKLF